MTAPPSGNPSQGNPSQRGPIVVVAVLVVVLVVILGLLLVVGLRLFDDWRAEIGAAAERKAGRESESAERVPEPTEQGTVRFQVVTDQRPLTGTSCPGGKGWTEHLQECLRLGEGFPALATAQADVQNGQPVVTVRLEPPADRTLAKFTRTANGGRLAMLAGDRVITAPTVSGPITGGMLQINGDFTRATAERLADQINGG